MSVPFSAHEEAELRKLVDAAWDCKESGDERGFAEACANVATFERQRRYRRLAEISGEARANQMVEIRPNQFERPTARKE